MNENMTQSEQIKWVFVESARMVGRPFKPVIALYIELGRTIAQPIFDLVEMIQESKIQNLQTRNLLEDLADETLIDRMLKTPVHIPVIANDEPVTIPVRFKIHRLSIDGILAR